MFPERDNYGHGWKFQPWTEDYVIIKLNRERRKPAEHQCASFSASWPESCEQPELLLHLLPDGLWTRIHFSQVLFQYLVTVVRKGTSAVLWSSHHLGHSSRTQGLCSVFDFSFSLTWVWTNLPFCQSVSNLWNHYYTQNNVSDSRERNDTPKCGLCEGRTVSTRMGRWTLMETKLRRRAGLAPRGLYTKDVFGLSIADQNGSM